jgi:uncharacterized membrane protein (DUF106 family)
MNMKTLLICVAVCLGYMGAADASDLAAAQRRYQENQANWAWIHAQEAAEAQRTLREQMQQMQEDQAKMQRMQERYNCIASGRSSC